MRIVPVFERFLLYYSLVLTSIFASPCIAHLLFYLVYRFFQNFVLVCYPHSLLIGAFHQLVVPWIPHNRFSCVRNFPINSSRPDCSLATTSRWIPGHRICISMPYGSESIPTLVCGIHTIASASIIDRLRPQTLRIFAVPHFLVVLLWEICSYTHLSHLIVCGQYRKPSPRLATVVWRGLCVDLALFGVDSIVTISISDTYRNVWKR